MMKRILFICMMVVASGVTVSAQSRHRHQHKDAVITVQQDDQSVGIDVYSDTLSAVDGNDSICQTVISDMDDDNDEPVTDENRFDPKRFSDPLSYYAAMWSSGLGGVLIAIFILLLILLFFSLPIIILFVIFRYLFKRHNDHVEMQKKMMEEGKMMRDINSPTVYYDTMMRNKGVRNISIGAGLVLMFMCWHSSFLTGIGFLVLCLGIGQMYIAHTSGKKEGEDNRRSDSLNNDLNNN